MAGEEGLGGRVKPVQVLEHENARLPRALGVGQALHQPQQLALARLRVHARRRAQRIGHREEVEHQRQVLGEALVEQEQLAGDSLARGALGVALCDLEVVSQKLKQGHERH